MPPIPPSVQLLATEGSESDHLVCVTTDTTAKQPSSSSFQSLNEPGPFNRAINAVGRDSSFQSYSPPGSASNTVSKFMLLTQWRPLIMDVIQRKDESLGPPVLYKKKCNFSVIISEILVMKVP